MSLGPGTHLGSYEIISAIGAGGMGEVYRARHARAYAYLYWRRVARLFVVRGMRL
jgi:hypothetical protein